VQVGIVVVDEHDVTPPRIAVALPAQHPMDDDPDWQKREGHACVAEQKRKRAVRDREAAVCPAHLTRKGQAAADFGRVTHRCT